MVDLGIPVTCVTYRQIESYFPFLGGCQMQYLEKKKKKIEYFTKKHHAIRCHE